MRYVPNLIPQKSKVLPEYFKGSINNPTRKSPGKDTLMWFFGLLLFLSAFKFINHPLLVLIFGTTGFILIPPGHRFIERKMCFSLTPTIKTVTILILLAGSWPLTTHYSKIDEKETFQQKLVDDKIAKEKGIADKKEQQRRDSFFAYMKQSYQSRDEHKLAEANRKLQHALVFVGTQADNEIIEKQKIAIASIEALDLVKAGEFLKALPAINSLIVADPTNTELVYTRAVCYSKTGQIQQAVLDLKPLIQSGNGDAEKLHNKINPLRKRIIGYETLCCDGSTSNARGRGACSHHGGVCDWNHPIYEEYRKYE